MEMKQTLYKLLEFGHFVMCEYIDLFQGLQLHIRQPCPKNSQTHFFLGSMVSRIISIATDSMLPTVNCHLKRTIRQQRSIPRIQHSTYSLHQLTQCSPPLGPRSVCP